MPQSSFRPIYYLGCKNEFAVAIKAALDELDPARGPLLDLFAGTGAVAAAVNSERKVATVDIQEYSRVLCSAVLNPARLPAADIARILVQVKADRHKALKWCLEPLLALEEDYLVRAQEGDVEPIVALVEAPPIYTFDAREDLPADMVQCRAVVVERLKKEGLLRSPDSTVSRLFGGVYFSYKQALALDGMLATAAASVNEHRDTLVASALSTASAVVNTVGKQFAQPIRPRTKSGEVKAGLLKAIMRDRTSDPFAAFELWLRRYASLSASVRGARTLRLDYTEALERNSDYGIVYADPPYTRDHYSRFYHVLETMCLRDEPQLSMVKRNDYSGVTRGVYRTDRHQSDFCIRSQAPGAFERLFAATSARGLPLLLSYSPHESGDGTHPRVVSTETIMEIARSFYGRVEAQAIAGSVHNNLNSSELKLKEREHAELLVKCYRK